LTTVGFEDLKGSKYDQVLHSTWPLW